MKIADCPPLLAIAEASLCKSIQTAEELFTSYSLAPKLCRPLAYQNFELSESYLHDHPDLPKRAAILYSLFGGHDFLEALRAEKSN